MDCPGFSSPKSRWERRAREPLMWDQDNFNIQLPMDLRPGLPVLTNGPEVGRTRLGRGLGRIGGIADPAESS